MLKFGLLLVAIIITIFSIVALGGGKRTSGIASGVKTTVTPTAGQEVPLPTGEDVIRLFFRLINDGEAAEAVGMMDENLVTSASDKQEYGVTFAGFSAVKVTAIEPSMEESWTEGIETYRVDLDISLKPEGQKTLWPEGPDTRWVSVKKVNGLFKIHEIATGP